MLVNGKQQCLCWQLPNVMFLYIILHMAVKFQGTNINVLLLATIDREKYCMEVYPISLYVQGWQQRYGWYGHGHTNFFVYSTGPRSHTSKGLAIYMHAATL